MSKPTHNKYDNIWEIRMSGYPTEEDVRWILEKEAKIRYETIGNALIHSTVGSFLKAVTSLKKNIRQPVWKIVIPSLEGTGGAIYYIVREDSRSHVFRGTYGYMGTGPRESALVETVLEQLGLRLEVRDGDYLLRLIK